MSEGACGGLAIGPISAKQVRPIGVSLAQGLSKLHLNFLHLMSLLGHCVLLPYCIRAVSQQLMEQLSREQGRSKL